MLHPCGGRRRPNQFPAAHLFGFLMNRAIAENEMAGADAMLPVVKLHILFAPCGLCLIIKQPLLLRRRKWTHSRCHPPLRGQTAPCTPSRCKNITTSANPPRRATVPKNVRSLQATAAFERHRQQQSEISCRHDLPSPQTSALGKSRRNRGRCRAQPMR